jgi:hypothetical protein
MGFAFRTLNFSTPVWLRLHERLHFTPDFRFYRKLPLFGAKWLNEA